ncbi:MAG: chromate transporter [Bacillota bacterium]
MNESRESGFPKPADRSKALLWQLFLSFLRIGAFTIGGGYAMVPLIEQDIVERHEWLTGEEFVDMLALAQSAPGVLAVNTAIIVGYRIAGVAGSASALLGAVLPSLVVIILVASVLLRFQENRYVLAFMKGTRPAVVALLVLAAYTIGKKAVSGFRGAALGVAAILAVLVLRIHPIAVIVLAGLLGPVIFHRNGTSSGRQS